MSRWMSSSFHSEDAAHSNNTYRAIQSTATTPPTTKTPLKESPAKKTKSRARCGHCEYNGNASKYSNYCCMCGKAMCPAHSAPTTCIKCNSEP